MGRAELEAEIAQLRAEYVIEPLALGWFCRNGACRAFNGDAKEFLIACRSCGSARPQRASSAP
jgi:hypothetical protein